MKKIRLIILFLGLTLGTLGQPKPGGPYKPRVDFRHPGPKPKEPKYMICLRIHQVSGPFDNSIPDFDMWIETSPGFYGSLRPGQELGSKFKSGSFWMSGKIGKIKVKVIDKKVIK